MLYLLIWHTMRLPPWSNRSPPLHLALKDGFLDRTAIGWCLTTTSPPESCMAIVLKPLFTLIITLLLSCCVYRSSICIYTSVVVTVFYVPAVKVLNFGYIWLDWPYKNGCVSSYHFCVTAVTGLEMGLYIS